MYKILTKMLAAVAVVFALAATPAAAQATRTWVSGVGDDANPCSRTAPCKTFAGAISKTAPSGEISVLDPGGFGAVTITKSITISSIGAEAGVLTTLGGNGVVINIAGVDGRVVLRGLDIECVGTGGNGVRVISAFDVLIEDSVIHGCRNTATTAGVLVNTTTTSRVTIRNSTLHSNSLGISVTAQNGSGHVKLYNSLLLDNFVGGLSVDSTGTVGNDVEIFNNQIIGASGLIQTNGGVVRTYGSNVIPSAATALQSAATE